ncbi:MAG TPA: hypothetical protein VGM10_32075 [Actinocrinis sp.]|jgi:hypothetical protein
MPAAQAVSVAEVAAAVAENWSRISVSTEPVDRAQAEAAVRRLYELGGIAAAPEIIWCQSPVEAARLVAQGDGRFGGSLREELRTGPWLRARAQVADRLGRDGWPQAWRETCGPTAAAVPRLVEQITGAVAAAGADDAERTALLVALTYADHGQHDAAWLPLFEAYREAAMTAGAAEGADAPVLHALSRVAEQVHWWWPFERAAILCERPNVLHLDEQGRLHQGDGPALAYQDGFALYRWHGVTIAENFAQTLASLTPVIIQQEPNVELRRIMLEHYGHDRYILDSGAKPVQHDEAGRLWRVDLPGDEPITMVEVVNSTAEPDGTFRTYWLRVPPHTRTARAAVAWTFGLSDEEYQPQVQT